MEAEEHSRATGKRVLIGASEAVGEEEEEEEGELGAALVDGRLVRHAGWRCVSRGPVRSSIPVSPVQGALGLHTLIH